MKKIIAICAAALIACQSVCLADGITVKVNNVPVEFDVQPQIIEGRTMVPMRKIFETLGAQVEWLETTSTILANKNEKVINMKIGKNSFNVTDLLTQTNKKIEIEVPPQIVEGRTLVPVRAISESLDMDVTWDGDTQTVYINSK